MYSLAALCRAKKFPNVKYRAMPEEEGVLENNEPTRREEAYYFPKCPTTRSHYPA